MRGVFVFVSALLISGCTTPYRMTELTDKFSDPNAPMAYAIEDNAIDFPGPTFGIPVSQMNGFVTRDRKTGKVISVGFNSRFVNESGSRWLNIRSGDEVVFLADGDRIVAKAFNAKMDHDVRRLSTGVTTYYFDFAQYGLTPDQFRRIAYARNLEFQVRGSDGVAEFPRKDFGFRESFQKNLRQFYDDQVAPYL